MLQDQDLLSIQEVRAKVEAAWQAAQRLRDLSQAQIDSIVEAMAAAARDHAARLAEMAVTETGYGNATDKTAKNMLAARLLPDAIRGLRTVGVIREIPDEKRVEVGVPVGVVAAILPTTNPTSTAIYKAIIALKGANSIVISPHPRAKHCTAATAQILHDAAVQAGAPPGAIQCLTLATLEATNALMKHEKTAVILSTGGAGIVKAAYSSGKPAFGVGPGNVPVLLDSSADVSAAVAKVVQGKNFDYGTLCSSEQTLVAEETLRQPILAALQANGAFLCDTEQGAKVARTVLTPRLGVNPECVGQPAAKIARMAGFSVPESTTILAAEIGGIGKEHPLSAEKLSPVLALYFVKDFAAALDACEAILRLGGLGHTCVIHARDEARIRQYGLRMPAFRVLVNTPSPQGSTGITTSLQPAMTLGCGAIAGNATGDNVGPLHLVHIKRIAEMVREVSPVPLSSSTAMSSPPNIDRHQLLSAVERYVASRGLKLKGPETSVAASVVDRFLAQRQAPPSVTAPAPAIDIVPFVCEDDVRQAMRRSQKIHIGPRTILTPSARDLGAQYDILVMTDRPPTGQTKSNTE
ncbi:MAG: aldehyde dehydrogenase family protein [Bryobacteraceae bacterium]|nr:aldehyde dehydrogenase family protein [Bryobacteraceae bacterium]